MAKRFTNGHPKPHRMTDCAHIHQPRRFEDVVTKRQRTQFVQSLMASVGESQLLDIGMIGLPVWYLSITESRSVRNTPHLLIVTWWCYNSSCPPYARSQANSSSFSRIVPRRTRQSTYFTFLPITLPNDECRQNVPTVPSKTSKH